MRADTTFEEQIGDSDLSKKLKTCDQNVATNIQNTNALQREVLACFNDGVYTTSSNRAKELNIPHDVIEKSRGSWVRQELPNWYKNHVEELYPVIPYLNRIINDYDALKGEYWKPPTNAEACEMVPRAFRDEWLQANKALARWLVNALNQNFLTRFTCTYSYGSQQDKQTKADMDDGLSLAFALVTLSSPNSSEYRDSIDRQIHNCAELAASGNPSEFVKSARITLQEAIRLNLPVRWHVGKKIIDILSDRCILFARDLMMMANSCLDPEDAAAPFDALLTKIEDINLKIKEVNGDSWWTSTTVTRAHSAQAGDKSQICKFGMNCNKRQSGECKRIHTSGKGKGKGGSNNSQPTKPDSKTRCAKQGCKENKSQKGDLCGACFNQAKIDGGYQNFYGKRVVIKALKNQERQKVRKAIKGQNTTANSALDKTVKKTAQLALTAAPKPEPTHIFMSIDEYNEVIGKKVNENHAYANHTETMLVIGEALERHTSGPASYKRRIVSEFMKDESILNIPLNDVILKFKNHLSNK